MDLTRYPSAEALLAEAGAYLVEREAEHNLSLGILSTLRGQPEVYPEPADLLVVHDAGRIALVAVRTPPHGVVLSEPGVPPDRIGAAVEALVAGLAVGAPGLPTAVGPKSTVGPFVVRWADVTERAPRLEQALRIYRLEQVRPHPPVAGGWRIADHRDRDLLRDWFQAFHAEALPPGAPPPEDAAIERLVSRDDRFAYLWEADARAVSLVVAAARTPNGRRVGPVYTPPEHRRRGFAGALTAAASQDQLDRGCRFCFLFTDLANPTSNAIYQAVGYEPVTDFDEYRLGTQ